MYVFTNFMAQFFQNQLPVINEKFKNFVNTKEGWLAMHLKFGLLTNHNDNTVLSCDLNWSANVLGWRRFLCGS